MLSTIVGILMMFAIGLFCLIWAGLGGLLKILESGWTKVYDWVRESSIGNQLMHK